MNNKTKKRNWQRGTEALDNLVSFDFKVHAFSDIHFRINDRLDVWPSTKRWYDLKTGRKDNYEELERFVKSFFNYATNTTNNKKNN